ncbi:MAG: hypothetical protein RL180_1013 [Pseudomonadota bacterium]
MSTRDAQPVQTALSIDPCDADARQQALRAALASQYDASAIHWLAQTSSTSDMLRQQAISQSGPMPAVVVANQQQCGRGQSGRVWQSPVGNLYLSFLTRLASPVQGRLALEVALAVLDMPLLQQVPQVGVKWPNDLHQRCATTPHTPDGSAKWGGILIEPEGAHHVIIGIGINATRMHVTDQAVTDLATLCQQPIDLVELAAQTVQALQRACATFDAHSPHLVERFAARDVLADHAVVVQHPAHADLHGIAQGIDAHGALHVRTSSRSHWLYSGHVRRCAASAMTDSPK